MAVHLRSLQFKSPSGLTTAIGRHVVSVSSPPALHYWGMTWNVIHSRFFVRGFPKGSSEWLNSTRTLISLNINYVHSFAVMRRAKYVTGVCRESVWVQSPSYLFHYCSLLKSGEIQGVTEFGLFFIWNHLIGRIGRFGVRERSLSRAIHVLWRSRAPWQILSQQYNFLIKNIKCNTKLTFYNYFGYNIHPASRSGAASV